MTQSQWIPMEIEGRRQETPTLVSFRMIPKLEETHFDFQAGQSVKISLAGREGVFAIASEPEEKRFVEFLIKDQADSVGHEVCQLKAGDPMKISPPFGKGYPLERLKGKDVLLIGIGSALAPLRSLFKSILRKNQQFGEVTFLYGARTLDEIPYRDEFDFWKKKIRLYLAISQAESSAARVTELLSHLSFHPEKTVACICGTSAMQKEVTNLLENAGISKDNIFLNH
ncbi:MAG: hypothetical protein HY585_05720 [Candidatus Omnitrophica bacterium]|nr:hypothetical protein [Candidatus Omnitrophota bacterium]